MSEKVNYVFSVYSYHHGFIIQFLRSFFGIDDTFNFFIRFYRVFGVNLVKIKTGNQVVDFHKKQILALNSFNQFLTNYEQSKFILSDEYTYPKNVSIDKRNPWLLQRLKEEHWKLYVDFFIFNIEYKDNIYFWIDKSCVQKGFREIVQKTLGIKIIELKLSSRLFESFFVAAHAFVIFSKTFFRAFGFGVRQIPKGIIAVEFVDPSLNSKSVTHSDFLLSEHVGKKDLVRYCGTKNSEYKENYYECKDVIFLDQLTLSWREAFEIMSYGLTVLKSSLFNSRSFRQYFQELEVYRHHILLCSMFRRSNISVHFFTTFANGKTGLRNISACVTSACHKYNIVSCSNQTRVQYIDDCWYYFEAFDVFFIWGQAWIESLKMTNYIDHFEIVGCPYMNSYELLSNSHIANNKHSICMILGDVLEDYPSHYTSDYTKKSLIILFEGIKNFVLIGNEVDLTIRLKRVNSIKIVESFIESLSYEGFTIVIDDVIGESYQQLIVNSDYIFSIGFTSPGMEGILLNKRAAYITEYSGIYSHLVSEIADQCILSNSKEVFQFLEGKTTVNSDLLDKLDPFRDFQVSNRIGKFIKSEVLNKYDKNLNDISSLKT